MVIVVVATAAAALVVVVIIVIIDVSKMDYTQPPYVEVISFLSVCEVAVVVRMGVAVTSSSLGYDEEEKGLLLFLLSDSC